MDGFHVDPRLKRVELRSFIRYLMSHVFEMHIIPSTSLSLENDTSKICSPPSFISFWSQRFHSRVIVHAPGQKTPSSPLGHTTPRLLLYTANAISVRDD